MGIMAMKHARESAHDLKRKLNLFILENILQKLLLRKAHLWIELSVIEEYLNFIRKL